MDLGLLLSQLYTIYHQLNLGVIHDTRITGRIYTRELVGYQVVASDAPRVHHVSMELFYQDYPHFVVEAHQKNRPNVVRFHMETGEGL